MAWPSPAIRHDHPPRLSSIVGGCQELLSTGLEMRSHPLNAALFWYARNALRTSGAEDLR